MVNKINKEKLDPVTMYETNIIRVMLSREELAVPEKEDDDEADEDYRERLIDVSQC